MSITAPLKSPFPAFGGKSAVADEVWRRLGDVRNYIEPFAFTAAVLLRRPGGAGSIETINDLNSYVSNFWRAVQRDPDAVAAHADYPVIEDDLHARHRWLVTSSEAQNKLQRVREDPDYCDPKIADWWCWGACCWIGSGWCEHPEWEGRGTALQDPRHVHALAGSAPRHKLTEKLPHMTGGRGVHASPGDGPRDRQPALGQAGWGVNALGEKRPRVPSAVGGYMPGVINNTPDDTHRQQLADAYSRGRGVNGHDAVSTTERRRAWLTDWINRLADRMRPVRVCCGHWARLCDSDSTLTRLGLTGVFLDPPYRKTLADGTANRASHIYANDKHQDVGALCDEVQAWCLKWGGSPDIRIALCGLEGEYPEIERAGWTKWAWKSGGGYGNRTERGKKNSARERIWFSPACLPEVQCAGLFAGVGEVADG